MSTVVAAPLTLSDEQRSALERMARSSSLPHRQVTQAQALLWAGDGLANEEIARRSGVDPDAVRRWRKRFAKAVRRVPDLGRPCGGSQPVRTRLTTPKNTRSIRLPPSERRSKKSPYSAAKLNSPTASA